MVYASFDFRFSIYEMMGTKVWSGWLEGLEVVAGRASRRDALTWRDEPAIGDFLLYSRGEIWETKRIR